LRAELAAKLVLEIAAHGQTPIWGPSSR
jgi:hypothetical protein